MDKFIEKIREELQFALNPIRFFWIDYLSYDWNNFLLFLIKKTNRCKDRNLSWELHKLADGYDPWPTGDWND